MGEAGQAPQAGGGWFIELTARVLMLARAQHVGWALGQVTFGLQKLLAANSCIAGRKQCRVGFQDPKGLQGSKKSDIRTWEPNLNFLPKSINSGWCGGVVVGSGVTRTLRFLHRVDSHGLRVHEVKNYLSSCLLSMQSCAEFGLGILLEAGSHSRCRHKKK